MTFDDSSTNGTGCTSVPKVLLGGVEVSKTTWSSLLSLLAQEIREPRDALYVGLYASLVRALRRDESYAKDMRNADIVYPDGMAVQWALNVLDRSSKCQRTATTDLWIPLLQLLRESDVPLVLVGGVPAVNRAVAEKAIEQGVVVALARDGYFSGETERREVAREVRAVAGACVLVGLGQGVQERFVYEARGSATVGMQTFLTVGGLFDHVVGPTRRAPKRVQAMGLEWLWRVVQEPLRLGPRYVAGNLVFLAETVRTLRSAGGRWRW
jgi:N-acetylglucosaminyldiphosphoundecaprenol N-acetyl-beta-D-mannosaminyltransferase